MKKSPCLNCKTYDLKFPKCAEDCEILHKIQIYDLLSRKDFKHNFEYDQYTLYIVNVREQNNPMDYFESNLLQSVMLKL